MGLPATAGRGLNLRNDTLICRSGSSGQRVRQVRCKACECLFSHLPCRKRGTTYGWELVVDLPVEFSPGLFLSDSTPLFEKERNLCGLALVHKHSLPPFSLNRSPLRATLKFLSFVVMDGGTLS